MEHFARQNIKISDAMAGFWELKLDVHNNNNNNNNINLFYNILQLAGLWEPGRCSEDRGEPPGRGVWGIPVRPKAVLERGDAGRQGGSRRVDDGPADGGGGGQGTVVPSLRPGWTCVSTGPVSL